jgi:protein-L-isoaspartate(D-aspartate) O-methyltransferase
VTSAGIERLRTQGIRDERVLAAVAALDRARFVPEQFRREAEEDRPLPIGHGQTISQPYVVAFMTEALGLAGGERVLEVGTGSGWQTALLARLAREVWSIEIIPELAARAAQVLLGDLGLANVHLRVGDGGRGWPEAAPFDRMVVTAAPEALPAALVAQLAPRGRMVVPVGRQADDAQVLQVVERDAAGQLSVRDSIPVRFVPLTSAAAGSSAGVC